MMVDGEVSFGDPRPSSEILCDTYIQCTDSECARYSIITAANNSCSEGIYEGTVFAVGPPSETAFPSRIVGESIFTLLEANSTGFTRKLYRSLRRGSIPIVAENASLPFGDFIDWKNAIVQKTFDTRVGAVQLLNGINAKTIYKKRLACRFYLENFLGNKKGRHTLGTIITCAFQYYCEHFYRRFATERRFPHRINSSVPELC